MRADGVTRAACFVTSAYSSWSGCRQYRENLYDAVAPLGRAAPRLDKLRHYFNHPGFVEPVVDAVLAALAELPDDVRDDARLVFVTHSIPTAMNERERARRRCLRRPAPRRRGVVAARVAEETGRRARRTSSSSARAPARRTVPWLEPDVNDHLERWRRTACRPSCWCRSGSSPTTWRSSTTSTPRRSATAERLGLPAVRGRDPGRDPRFVAMVRDLLLERAAAERGEPVVRAERRGARPLVGRAARSAAAPTRAATAPGAVRRLSRP